MFTVSLSTASWGLSLRACWRVKEDGLGSIIIDKGAKAWSETLLASAGCGEFSCTGQVFRAGDWVNLGSKSSGWGLNCRTSGTPAEVTSREHEQPETHVTFNQQLPQPDIFIYILFGVRVRSQRDWACLGTADEDNEDQAGGHRVNTKDISWQTALLCLSSSF